MCLIDLETAFDRIRVSDVLKILQQRKLKRPIDIRSLIKEIYTNTSMRVKANCELSDNIRVTKGLGRGIP